MISSVFMLTVALARKCPVTIRPAFARDPLNLALRRSTVLPLTTNSTSVWRTNPKISGISTGIVTCPFEVMRRGSPCIALGRNGSTTSTGCQEVMPQGFTPHVQVEARVNAVRTGVRAPYHGSEHRQGLIVSHAHSTLNASPAPAETLRVSRKRGELVESPP